MAQSIVGTDLAATWAANSSRVCARVRVDWNRDGDYADAYEDITSRVLSLSISHALYDQVAGLPLLGGIRPSSASVQVINEARWFSPDNASGLVATYPLIAIGIYRFPIMIELGYYDLDGNPEYLTQFVGEIEGADEAESYGQATVNFGCTDNSIALLQHKASSAVAYSKRPDEVIAAVLTAAGVTVASLDYAMTVIPFSWMDDENGWEECLAAAQADGGMFYFGKEGLPTFRRMTAPIERADSRTSVATLNQGNAKALRDSVAWRDCYNRIIMEWAGRYGGVLAELYQAPRPLELAPGEVIVEECRLRYPSAALVTPVYDTDYTAVTAAPWKVSQAEFTLTMVSYGQRAELTITNLSAVNTIYINNLVLRGWPLIGYESQQKSFEDLSLLTGVKALPVRGNPYVQTQEQVARIGSYLLDRLSRPRRLLVWEGPASPWIELLDRVTLSHNTMAPNPGIDVDCYVLGIKESFAFGAQWDQELLLLPVTDVFKRTDYFILGESVYSTTVSDRAGY